MTKGKESFGVLFIVKSLTRNKKVISKGTRNADTANNPKICLKFI